MAEQPAMLIYRENKELIDMLTDAEAGMLLKALLAYFVDGEIIEMPISVKLVFISMKHSIDNNAERYAETCRRRKEAIQKRWQNTNEYNSIQKNTNVYNSISKNTIDTNQTETQTQTQTQTITQTQTETETQTKTKNINNNINKFIKPNISEISDYCKEKGYNVDAEFFWNYYESKGWVVGKSPMKSWKSAVSNWNKNKYNNQIESKYDAEKEYTELKEGELPWE